MANGAAGRASELQVALADGTRALHADGDLDTARRRFEQAYVLADRSADVPAMAEAALGLGGLWVREQRTLTGAMQLEARLQHVLPLLDDGSPLALRVRVRLAGEADYARGENSAIMAVLDEVREAGDPVVLAEALSVAHHCLLGPENIELRRGLAAEMTRASVRTGRRGDLLMGLLWQTVDAYSARDRKAGRLLSELRDHLKERAFLAAGFVVSAIDVMLAIRAGRLDDAESLARVCAENGAAAGDADYEWWARAQLATIRWYQGRLGELLPVLCEQVDSPVLSDADNSAVAALAVAAALHGDQRTAASALASLAGGGLAELPRSSSWLVTLNGIVEAAYLLDDADTAARAYELLLPYADLPMLGSLGVTCCGATHQALGVAALTMRHVDRAVEHLRAAVRRNIAIGHWPAVVASRQRLAQAHALRRRPGDTEAERHEREAAVSEAAGLALPVPDDRVRRTSGPFADCARFGKQWRLMWRDRSVLLADSVGMAHLAVLIANPRRDVRAADLAAGLAGLASLGAAGDNAQPVLDGEADRKSVV